MAHGTWRAYGARGTSEVSDHYGITIAETNALTLVAGIQYLTPPRMVEFVDGIFASPAPGYL